MPEPDYSDVLMDHFRNPRNAGSLRCANGRGTASAGNCGDVICIWIRVEDHRVSEVSFKCKGCAAAIACGSITTELAKGRHLDDVAMIAGETIVQALGNLPADKRHCADLAAEALAGAVMDYVTRSVDRDLPGRARSAD